MTGWQHFFKALNPFINLQFINLQHFINPFLATVLLFLFHLKMQENQKRLETG